MFSAHTPFDEAWAPADRDAVADVRELARHGLLTERMAVVAGAERTRLCGGAYDIAWRVVFQRATRKLERGRGHRACATSVSRMAADCLDRFHDDVEAALDDLLRHARVPIANLEGWIGSRLRASTVDGHRRRRGARGALQRPRLPRWLVEALGGDPWLKVLAVEILTWVGIPTTAGAGVWPLGAWAERRVAVTGDHRAGEAEVMNDVERVLAAMRQSRKWYDDFVERPLGRKETPVVPLPRTDPDTVVELPPLALIERHEVDDARLLQLAADAVAAIAVRLSRGEPPRSAVTSVLGTVFGASVLAGDMDRVPGAAPDDEERILRLIADPERLDRIVDTVLEIASPVHRP